MIKSLSVILSLLFFSLVEMNAQILFGNAQKFNDDWLFTLDESIDAASLNVNDERWRKLDLPHDWSVEAPLSPSLASCTGFLPGGVGTYHKHFVVNDKADRHYIYFEGAYNRSEVYLNGHLLGKRPNGYISFAYDMTPYLKEGDNLLSVRLDHSRYADSRWYTGSGIYRDVYIVSAPNIHLSQWGTTYVAKSITDKNANIEVDVNVDNCTNEKLGKLAVNVSVVDVDGKRLVSVSKSVDVRSLSQKVVFNLRNPHRWDINDPYLYTLKVELSHNGKKIDGCDIPMGIRSLDFDANKGFALNGKSMKVKGVCLHHDAGVLGAAVPQEVWERRLRNLKEIGVNAIRTSHNVQSPVLYDICDRIGLLVMDENSDEWEFPKRKWLEGWNQGTPGFDGTYDFFEEWIDRDVEDMVRRDRNHPSVFLWSVGNEVDYPNDPYSHPILQGSAISQPMYGGYDPKAPNAERIGIIAKRLASAIKKYDMSRPTTGAMAGVVMSNETEYPDAVDICGYNYTEDRYDMDHKTYPNRIIYGSENRSDIDAWYATRDRDFIFGQFIWTGTDYLGESRPWPSRGFYTGLLDFASNVKPRGQFRASLWSDKPMIYIGTYPMRERLSVDAWDIWNYEEGQTIRVVCYTNASQARLMLNGELVGEMKCYDEKSGIIYWDIPYKSGKLVAEGCDANGNVVSTYEIQSSKRPYNIRATVEKSSVCKSKSTVHVTVDILDEDGVIVKLADNEISCTIDGPARLLGLEGANNSDMSDYTDNKHRAYHGTLMAYIQTTGEAGKITLKFTSPLLKGATVVVDAE